MLEQVDFVGGPNRSVTIYLIDRELYRYSNRRKQFKFKPEEKGLFGIDQKVMLLSHEDETPSKTSAPEIVKFRRILDERLNNSGSTFLTQNLKANQSQIEIRRGIFLTPLEEIVNDHKVKEALMDVSRQTGIAPYYGGSEYFTGLKSWGFHLHYSV